MRSFSKLLQLRNSSFLVQERMENLMKVHI